MEKLKNNNSVVVLILRESLSGKALGRARKQEIRAVGSIPASRATNEILIATNLVVGY